MIISTPVMIMMLMMTIIMMMIMMMKETDNHIMKGEQFSGVNDAEMLMLFSNVEENPR